MPKISSINSSTKAQNSNLQVNQVLIQPHQIPNNLVASEAAKANTIDRQSTNQTNEQNIENKKDEESLQQLIEESKQDEKTLTINDINQADAEFIAENINTQQMFAEQNNEINTQNYEQQESSNQLSIEAQDRVLTNNQISVQEQDLIEQVNTQSREQFDDQTLASKGEIQEQLKTLGISDKDIEQFIQEIDLGKFITENNTKEVGAYKTTQSLKKGLLGEISAAQTLATQEGHKILNFKPDIFGTNQGGVDIVSIKEEKVYLIDNKAYKASGNVNNVSALTTNFAKNLDTVRQDLLTVLNQPDITQAEYELFDKAIRAIDEGNYVRAVTNAYSSKTGLTEKLEQKGIQFIDLNQNKNEKTQFKSN